MNFGISGKILKIKLFGGWKGLAVRNWSGLAFDPAELTKNPSQVFKSDRNGIVVLKEIDGGNGKIPFVVKKNSR